MSNTYTCLNCGYPNRSDAKFCQHCGASLSASRPLGSLSEPPASLPPAAAQKSGGLFGWLRKKPPADTAPLPPALPPTPPGGTRRLSAAPEAESPAGTAPLGSLPGAPPQKLKPLQPGSPLQHPQDPSRRYLILAARPLARSVYYDALEMTCSACGTVHPAVPPDGLCTRCRTPLRPVLVHERQARSQGPLTAAEIDRLLAVSRSHPHMLTHYAILQYPATLYTVVERPDRWGVLVRGRRTRFLDEAVSAVAEIGQAVTYLHEQGFAHSEVGGDSLESLVTLGNGDFCLADLSSCTALTQQEQVNRDLTFLGMLLFYLATGEELQRKGMEETTPPPLRHFVERAIRGEYATVRDLLSDLASLPTTESLGGSLNLVHGQATDPGLKHPRNEDAVVAYTFSKEQAGRPVPVGFYLVADGMGGHAAGDVASKIVNQVVTDWLVQAQVLPDPQRATRKLVAEQLAGELFSQAIQQANESIYRQGRAAGNDMGSTVTAALVLGDMATIVNVGDSRTYLLREGRLMQITQDHSLVARLVDAGIIKPEEVRTHPQRNQIYRCLGHKPEVEVDTFTLQVRRGDRLILCCDGLWEMVPDPTIQGIVERAPTPQAACEELVAAANRAGGEDNISVIVVAVE